MSSESSCQLIRAKKLDLHVENSLFTVIDSLSLKEQRIVAALLKLSKQFATIFVSQSTLGFLCGLSRTETNKTLKSLLDRGIVWWDKNDHAPTRTYNLLPVFQTYTARKLLYDKIKNLWRLGYGLKSVISSLRQVGTLLNIKGLFINDYDSMRESQSTHARARAAGIDNRFFKKEREVMEEGNINPIKQSIRDIKSLKLTKWGQIMLMAYPDEALKHADAQMKQTKSPSNPYGLFLSFCSKYCQQHGYDKDWRIVNFLKETYSMPDNAQMILETAKPEPKSPKRESSDFSQQLAAKIEVVNQEDPFEAALKIEKYRQENPAISAFIPHVNPWLNRLSEADRQRIIEIINNSTHKEQN